MGKVLVDSCVFVNAFDPDSHTHAESLALLEYLRVKGRAIIMPAHAWFENFWQTPLDDQPGYTVVEIMHKALAPESDPHKVRGMYIMGENPAMSDPDLHHALLASAEGPGV